MLPEIGSNYWISTMEVLQEEKELSLEPFGISGTDFCWVSSGRSAIGFVLDDLEFAKKINKKAVLPSFTCDTVIKPFIDRQYSLSFVEIDYSMEINSHDLMEKIRESSGGVLIFHRYFGFDKGSPASAILSECKKNNVTIIEDCTQSLYSGKKRVDADYYVGSIRKWCGVPDGGFAVKKGGFFRSKPKKYDAILEEVKLKASLQKYRYIFHNQGEKHIFLNEFQTAEKILSEQKTCFAISPTSRKIQSNLDVLSLKEKRRKNYMTLLSSLNTELAFNKINPFDVPLYCPIISHDRLNLQRYLRDNSIYAPILWPKYEKISSSLSAGLYENLLCLPIDQRYDIDDMDRMASLVNDFAERRNDRK